MISTMTIGLLWASAIGCGLMAGVYFAFSTFVMTALCRIGQSSAVAAMNAINDVIQRSAFMPVFFGSTLTSAILVAVALTRWDEPGSIAILLGGILYVAGMFVVTIVRNVPLNNQLAAADPSGADASELWGRYLRDWTFWNHVRTLASLGAHILFVAALAGI